MKTIPIQAELRERVGKGGARSARREGRIPAVLYGHGERIHLSVDRREFVRAMVEAHGENVIFDVTLPGQSPLKSIAREIQHDPVTRSTIHVDFQHIDMSKKINVSVNPWSYSSRKNSAVNMTRGILLTPGGSVGSGSRLSPLDPSAFAISRPRSFRFSRKNAFSVVIPGPSGAKPCNVPAAIAALHRWSSQIRVPWVTT